MTVMKKHERIRKFKQQNHCFVAVQDFYFGENDADVEDGCLNV